MIDLFAGTGTFTYGLEKTGKIQCVFANDMDESSKKIYDVNFTHELCLGNLQDINVETIPEHDILTCGIPCQPFSIAGKREGFCDARSNVFWKVMEIFDTHNPSIVIIENVKNLVSHDDGKSFETITKSFMERNYHIHHKVLDTAKITGIPQHRERIYIVCIKSKEISDKFTMDFPLVAKNPVTSLLEKTVDEKYYYTDKSVTWDLVKSSVVKKIQFINIDAYMFVKIKVMNVLHLLLIRVVEDITFR
jgi:DNA (cytosine-5)-methyltransferase 1